VIEASGVSDPVRIAQVGLLDPALRLNAIVVAVDACHLDAQLRDPLVGDMVQRQICGATALVLTKTDLAGPGTTETVAGHVAGMAPGAVVMAARHGEIPLAVFLDAAAPPRRPQGLLQAGGSWKSQAGDRAGMADVGSFSYATRRCFDRQRLRQALRTLPVPLLRAKGIVRLGGQDSVQEIHVVGGRLRIARLPAVQVSESVFVFIGCFDDSARRQLRQRLESALEPG
jgi:G3E family GTPase